MTALLAADPAAVLHHVLVDVFVAYLGLGVVDAQFVEGLVQTEVAHHRGDHGVHQELTPLLQILAVDVENVIAGDDLTLLVHAQTPVGVAVVGKAHVQAVVHHKLL